MLANVLGPTATETLLQQAGKVALTPSLVLHPTLTSLYKARQTKRYTVELLGSIANPFSAIPDYGMAGKSESSGHIARVGEYIWCFAGVG